MVSDVLGDEARDGLPLDAGGRERSVSHSRWLRQSWKTHVALAVTWGGRGGRARERSPIPKPAVQSESLRSRGHGGTPSDFGSPFCALGALGGPFPLQSAGPMDVS